MRAVTIVEFADGEIKIAVNKPHDDPLTPDEVGIALMQYGIAKLMENIPKGTKHDFTDIPLSEETNSESVDIIPPGEALHFHGNGMESACSTYHRWGVRSPDGTDYPMTFHEAVQISKHNGWPVVSRDYDGPWEVASER